MKQTPVWKIGILFVLLSGATCLGYRAVPYSVRERATLENDEPWDEMRFDRTRWIARTPWTGDGMPGRLLRALMTDDVIANVLRPGMMKREVKDRLGPPDPSPVPGPIPASASGSVEWSYGLGPWERWGMDGADDLIVRFDHTGRVTGFERVHR